MSIKIVHKLKKKMSKLTTLIPEEKFHCFGVELCQFICFRFHSWHSTFSDVKQQRYSHCCKWFSGKVFEWKGFLLTFWRPFSWNRETLGIYSHEKWPSQLLGNWESFDRPLFLQNPGTSWSTSSSRSSSKYFEETFNVDNANYQWHTS